MPRSTSRAAEPPARASRPAEKSRLAQQAFEIAAPRGSKYMPRRVEHQRGRRQEIGAEPDRADEPVLDPDQRDACARRRLGQPVRQARGPDGDGARAARRRQRRRERASAPRGCGGTPARRPPSGEIGDPPPLPERHPEADGDAAVGRFDPSPLGDDRQRLLERCGCCETDRDSGSRRGRCRRKFRRPSGGSRAAGRVAVLGHAPARIGGGSESGHRHIRKQREKTDLAADAVDATARSSSARDRIALDHRDAPRPRRREPRPRPPGGPRRGQADDPLGRKIRQGLSSIAAAVSGHAVRSAARSVREGSARATTPNRPCLISGSVLAAHHLPPTRAATSNRAPPPHAPAVPDLPTLPAETRAMVDRPGATRRRARRPRRGRRSVPAAHAIKATGRAKCLRRARRLAISGRVQEQYSPRGAQPFPPDQPLRPLFADSGHRGSLSPARPLSMKIAADPSGAACRATDRHGATSAARRRSCASPMRCRDGGVRRFAVLLACAPRRYD